MTLNWVLGWLSRGRSLARLAPLLTLLGCAPRHTVLAAALDKAYGFECAPDRIRVLGHRFVASDELWALEACGTRIELERGLEFPRAKSNLQELSEREIADIRENLKPGPAQPGASVISDALVESAREKARELCVLGDAGDRFAVATRTPDEQAACQQRLATSTAPLGTERDEEGITRHWFRVGPYAFPTFVSYHTPACGRLTLTDTPEYCACEKAAGRRANCDAVVAARLASLRDAQTTAEDETETEPNTHTEADGTLPAQSQARRSAEAAIKLYARGGLGLGYLTSTGDNVATISSVTLDWNAWGGVLLNRRLALGLGVSWHQGLSEDSVDFVHGGSSGNASWRSDALAGALFVSGMPTPLPLRFDLEAGLGLLTRAAPRAESGRSRSTGFYAAVGVGWEAPGEYVDLGLSGKAFLMNTDADEDSFQTIGYGLVLNLGTHPRRPDSTYR